MHKNKLTNGHREMIIQLRAAIFERIRNVQLKALQSVFISFLSVGFSCVLNLWFKRYRRHIVYNDVMHDSVMCSLKLCHVTENRYGKCSVHLFRWNIFHSLWYEQNLLTNRIAGKQMNIKKIKLFWDNNDNKNFILRKRRKKVFWIDSIWVENKTSWLGWLWNYTLQI